MFRYKRVTLVCKGLGVFLICLIKNVAAIYSVLNIGVIFAIFKKNLKI